MPWLYLWLHSAAKTQSTVKRAAATLFRATPAGLPGDDDLGAMSAWYVWSSLGLYPAIPGIGGLAIGSPMFASATIHAGARTISIAATGRGSYVRRLEVDGRPHASTWLALPRRGRLDLHFTRATTPQKWGSGESSAPPSFPVKG
jgi:putative alpha-1,2-mannosidase